MMSKMTTTTMKSSSSSISTNKNNALHKTSPALASRPLIVAAGYML